MNIIINHDHYQVEVRAYFQVFYPMRDIIINGDEQPLYKVDVNASTIVVAYFDGQNLLDEVELNDVDGAVWSHYEGKEKVRKGKIYLKQLLYDLCSKITKVLPPWGILMGIRPTKLAFRLSESLGSYKRAEDELVEVYRLSREKAKLLVNVIKQEAPFVSQTYLSENKHSIYIGIPFCPSRCSYCSFTAYSKNSFKEAYKAYTDLLIKELEAFREVFSNVRSVYIGGGTPTSLNEDDFEMLVSKVRELLGKASVEFTVEAGRADSITSRKLLTMKRYGVNRISINPQTCHDKTLEKIGRAHTFADVVRVYEEARSLGFSHINMDLILGLPDESVTDTLETIKVITAMKPESITIHTMALKRGTLLSDQKKEYLTKMSGEIRRMLDETSKVLHSCGYHGYYLYRQKNMVGNFENVGYCLEGMESIYNIHTMEEKESIIAFGAGAISKKVCGHKVKRFDQSRDVNMYMKQLDEIVSKKKVFYEEVDFT